MLTERGNANLYHRPRCRCPACHRRLELPVPAHLRLTNARGKVVQLSALGVSRRWISDGPVKCPLYSDVLKGVTGNTNGATIPPKACSGASDGAATNGDCRTESAKQLRRFKGGLLALDVLESVLLTQRARTHVGGARLNLIQAGKRGDVESGLARLKQFSSDARARFISGYERTNEDCQLSFLGRSLPRASRPACLRALDQHVLDYTSEHTCKQSLLKAARRFARRWASRYLPGSESVFPPDLPTRSACAESGLRAGGLRGFLLSKGRTELSIRTEVLLGKEDPDDLFNFRGVDRASLVNDMQLIGLSCELAPTDGLPPLSSATCLAERGLKTRVVTKSPAYLHVVGHVARKRLLAGLKRDRHSASTLLGFRDGDLAEQLKGGASEECISTDLTRATDLLPLDLISALVDGLEDSRQFLDIEIRALRALSGPQRIRYPDLPGSPEFTSSRGILMGLPTSWGLLSLCHLFWWDRAKEILSARGRIPRRTVERRTRYQVCGDDAIAVGPFGLNLCYSEMVRLSGGLPSEGKHFVRGFPECRMVFIERLFKVESDGKEVCGLRRIPALPLKGLVEADLPPDYRPAAGSAVVCSHEIRRLLVFDSLWAQFPGDEVIESRLRQLVLRGPLPFRELPSVAHSVGLANGLPIRLGGSGIPTGRDQLSDYHLQRAVASIFQPALGIPSLLKGEMSSVWKLAQMLVETDMPDLFRPTLRTPGPLIRLLPSDPVPAPVRRGPWTGTYRLVSESEQQLLDSLVADCFRKLVFTIPESFRLPKLSRTAVRRAVQKWSHSLGAPPDLPRDILLEILTYGYPQEPLPAIWGLTLSNSPTTRALNPSWVPNARAGEGRARRILVEHLVEGRGRSTKMDPTIPSLDVLDPHTSP